MCANFHAKQITQLGVMKVFVGHTFRGDGRTDGHTDIPIIYRVRQDGAPAIAAFPGRGQISLSCEKESAHIWSEGVLNRGATFPCISF